MALDGARIFHVNVNCSNLERSRRFYAAGLGLEAAVRTVPEQVQPGAAFGLGEARWDAWILTGTSGFDGGAIDLLEWQVPPPTGRPPVALNQCGFQRLGALVPDLDATMCSAVEHGGAVWSEPFEHANDDGTSVRIVLANDPDGTAIELVEGSGPRLSFVSVTCADFGRSLAFYRALGFTEVARFPSATDDGAHLHVDGSVAMEEAVLTAPGGGEVLLMLASFTTPPAAPAAPRVANTLGMWRTALLVPDIDAATATLAAERIATISDPVSMEMGPGLPVLRFVCFAGPDGEVIELIEQPA